MSIYFDLLVIEFKISFQGCDSKLLVNNLIITLKSDQSEVWYFVFFLQFILNLK